MSTHDDGSQDVGEEDRHGDEPEDSASCVSDHHIPALAALSGHLHRSGLSLRKRGPIYPGAMAEMTGHISALMGMVSSQSAPRQAAESEPFVPSLPADKSTEVDEEAMRSIAEAQCRIAEAGERSASSLERIAEILERMEKRLSRL